MATLTLTELNTLFQGVSVTMTGLNGKKVRLAYQAQQPAQEHDENVVYIYVSEVDDDYNKLRDLVYFNSDPDVSDLLTKYTRVMEVQWSCYGPSAFDLANTIRRSILSESIRSVLATAQVYPLTWIAAPTRVPYQFNNRWWERTDVRVRFNVNTTYNEEVPYIESAEVLIDTVEISQNVIIEE